MLSKIMLFRYALSVQDLMTFVFAYQWEFLKSSDRKFSMFMQALVVSSVMGAACVIMKKFSYDASVLMLTVLTTLSVLCAYDSYKALEDRRSQCVFQGENLSPCYNGTEDIKKYSDLVDIFMLASLVFCVTTCVGIARISSYLALADAQHVDANHEVNNTTSAPFDKYTS